MLAVFIFGMLKVACNHLCSSSTSRSAGSRSLFPAGFDDHLNFP